MNQSGAQVQAIAKLITPDEFEANYNIIQSVQNLTYQQFAQKMMKDGVTDLLAMVNLAHP